MRIRYHVNQYLRARLVNTFIGYDIWALGKGLSEECPRLLGAARRRNDDLVRYKAITDHVSCHISGVSSTALCEYALAIVLMTSQALSLGMAEQHQTQHAAFHDCKRGHTTLKSIRALSPFGTAARISDSSFLKSRSAGM